jgi:hypothetical protein
MVSYLLRNESKTISQKHQSFMKTNRFATFDATIAINNLPKELLTKQ